jgi:Flp pilus assembly protein TadB
VSAWTVLPVAGGLVGLGIWLGYDALIPARPNLPAALSIPANRRTVPAAPSPTMGDERAGWTARAGRPLADALTRIGLGVGARVRRDLPICGRSPQRHLAEQATTGLLGLLLPPTLAVTLLAVGHQLPALAWTGGAAVLAVAGYLAPDAAVIAEATRRRRDARHTLSSYLDLTMIGLAGGAGIEQALTQAATTDHPTMTALRHALQAAVVRREPLWTPLDSLGRTLNITELRELATSLQLAGTEGAKIRASLAAKAAALRIRLLADIETNAQTATERMSLPLVVMFAGFLLFLTYPAFTQIINL